MIKNGHHQLARAAIAPVRPMKAVTIAKWQANARERRPTSV